MAIAIVPNAALTATRLTAKYIDINLQEQTEILDISLDPGDVTSTITLTGNGYTGLTPAGAIELFLTDVQALSNAPISVTIDRISKYTVTGLATTALFQPEPFVSTVADLLFNTRNPDKPAGFLNATVQIPAPIISAVGGHGGVAQAPPNSGLIEDVANNSHLASTVAFLQAYLGIKNTLGTAYVTGLTYQKSESSVISLPDIVDNK
jgi:hypothetical protein